MPNYIDGRSKEEGYSRNYSRKLRLEKPEVAMLARCKARAKELNLDFNLKIEDILIPNFCPILGLPLTIGEKLATDNSPLLDRIDNTKGYIRENIHVISRRANRIKNDATLNELKLLVSYLENLKNAS